MKKIIVIICSILIFVLVAVLIYANIFKKESAKYTKINIDGYTFMLPEEYNYKYNDEGEYGYFDNDKFIKSYIFTTSQTYSELVNYSSSYTDMGSDEVDSTTTELNFGSYEAFINNKVVTNKDNKKEDNLVIIIVSLSRKTLVIQYEIENNEEASEILESVQEGLNEIKKS